MEQQKELRKTCFIVMPISDVESYEPGHFGRVYEYIIKPACKAAGFEPIRADEVQITNHIVIDILRKILEAEMVICDLSSRNPNVLYELGIRQAFNRPVTIIKDSKTPRIFDIQGLRDIEYDETLRIDKINDAVAILSATLKNTSNMKEGEVNSIIQLLGVQPAPIPSVEVSTDTSLLLKAISDVGKRLTILEDSFIRGELPSKAQLRRKVSRNVLLMDLKGQVVKIGSRVRHPDFGEGVIKSITTEEMRVDFDPNVPVVFMIPGEEFSKLEPILEEI